MLAFKALCCVLPKPKEEEEEACELPSEAKKVPERTPKEKEKGLWDRGREGEEKGKRQSILQTAGFAPFFAIYFFALFPKAEPSFLT